MLDFSNLWRWKAGVEEINPERKASLCILKETEWSLKFEQLMRNRLIMGAIRYGRIGAKDKPVYDRISSIEKRLEKYKKTVNKEHLVDVANLCLCEFEEGQGYFKPIDDGEHTTIKY